MRIIRRWPRAIAILGNVPGALVLTLTLVGWQGAGRFDQGLAPLLHWPALGLALVLTVAFFLFAIRIAWLPLAVLDFVLGVLSLTLGLMGVWDMLVSGDDRSLVQAPRDVGLLVLGAAYLMAGVAVLVDRRARRPGTFPLPATG